MNKHGAYGRSSHSMLVIAGLFVLTLLSLPLLGLVRTSEIQEQSQTAERLAFEVASVKVNKSIDSRNVQQVMRSMTLHYLPGGRLVVRGVPIQWLILEAYNVSPTGGRIIFSPELAKSVDRSVTSEIYDIEAIAESGAIPAGASASVRNEKLRLMLQSLLVDRFKLAIRHEMKEVPVYLISVSKNGAGLTRASMDESACEGDSQKEEAGRFFGEPDPNSCHKLVGSDMRGFRGKAVDMSDLARAIEAYSDRPVIDGTGLKGIYNIELPAYASLRPRPPRPAGTEPNSEDLESMDPSLPTMSTVLAQLGLKWESTRASVEILVVEHFERPAQNQ